MDWKSMFFVATGTVKSAAAALAVQQGVGGNASHNNPYFMGAMMTFAATQIVEVGAAYFWSAQAKLGACSRYTVGVALTMLEAAAAAVAGKFAADSADGNCDNINCFSDTKAEIAGGVAGMLLLAQTVAASCSTAPRRGYTTVE